MEAFNSTLRVHDTLAQNRLRFAQRLMEMSEELTNLAKEGERLRKLVCDASSSVACEDMAYLAATSAQGGWYSVREECSRSRMPHGESQAAFR